MAISTEETSRQQIVEIGRRMYDKGYVVANDGNISIRLDEERILTTPTGYSKGYMNPENLAIVDLAGNLISGHKASTELPLHLYIYQERPDVRAVVHAHPAYATGFATAGIPLDRCVLAEIIVTLGAVPLADYAAPSTNELPKSIEPYVNSSDAFLLANHGVATVGKDLMDAYFKLERVEHSANIVFIARALGGEKVLSQDAVQKLYSLRGNYGLSDVTGPACQPEEHLHNEDCGCEHDLDESEFEKIVQRVITAVRSKS